MLAVFNLVIILTIRDNDVMRAYAKFIAFCVLCIIQVLSCGLSELWANNKEVVCWTFRDEKLITHCSRPVLILDRHWSVSFPWYFCSLFVCRRAIVRLRQLHAGGKWSVLAAASYRSRYSDDAGYSSSWRVVACSTCWRSTRRESDWRPAPRLSMSNAIN
jgi:hypothetical protein